MELPSKVTKLVDNDPSRRIIQSKGVKVIIALGIASTVFDGTQLYSEVANDKTKSAIEEAFYVGSESLMTAGALLLVMRSRAQEPITSRREAGQVKEIQAGETIFLSQPESNR